MIRGVYVGERLHLIGKTALLREDGEAWLAQFDDQGVTLSGAPVEHTVLGYEPHARFPSMVPADNPPADALGYGWHRFGKNDFRETTSCR